MKHPNPVAGLKTPLTLSNCRELRELEVYIIYLEKPEPSRGRGLELGTAKYLRMFNEKGRVRVVNEMTGVTVYCSDGAK